jgi:phosphoribosyl-ATP pyrophosphohydrolase/phosphoribosyl-AMP cyclohydrolase
MNTHPLTLDPSTLNFDKGQGLVTAVVQHHQTLEVLMVGHMNADALTQTQASGRVTFWSRTKDRLWTKGESSGHFLELRGLYADCDRDAVLVLAEPIGPTCHRGTRTCFDTEYGSNFLFVLESIVAQRATEAHETSYTARLLGKGLPKVAQKVGEEGVETVIAALAESDEQFLGESADLVFHLLVLLRAKGYGWADVARVLAERHAERASEQAK